MDYLQAQQIFEKSRKRKLANNTYLEKNSNGSYAIRLHSTQIIRFYPEKTVLFSGSYRTVTTKARINEFTKFNIWQKAGIWYISRSSFGCWDTKDAIVFADGITWNEHCKTDNGWTNTGENPKKITKLRKQAKQYAKDFVMALFAGQVSKPSNGDCWYCCLTAQDGRTLGEHTDGNHIISHIKEKYYVPSLCVNACKMFGVSKAAWWSLQELWENGKASNCFADVGKRQIESAIRRYCYRQLQTA